MTTIIIEGYFLESEAKKIKEKMNGKTYMNFIVEYGNHAGNCTVTVSSESEVTKKELYDMFVFCALSSM